MRSGKDLVSVWEELKELRGKVQPSNGKPRPQTARENDQALQQLQQLMGGVAIG